MIDSNLRRELLNTKELNDFRNICLKNKISPKELDEEILRHFGSLGRGGSAYNHEDPREAFKE